MNVTPLQSADSKTTTTTPPQLVTVADLPPGDPLAVGTAAAQYGPLWLYAKPVKFSGGAAFGTSDWSTLYTPGSPTLKAGSFYPSPTPYEASKPTGLSTVGDRRRVLNIPLLQCPVSAGTPHAATVVAIGKFFMTVPASDTALFAEFAGLAPEPSLGGQVELYR
jgi:hypothetical protein